MKRRLIGGLILALALVAALVVPRLLDPPVVDGSAGTAPPTSPPAVGDCVSDLGTGITVGPGGVFVAENAATFARCDAPHAGEVVQVVSDLPAADGTDAAAALTAVNARCIDGNVVEWGTAPGAAAGWRPELVVTTGAIAPSRQQSDAGQRWVGCVVGVYDSSLDRPLAQMNAVNLPPSLGSCISADGVAAGTTNGTDCATPHIAETFGRRDLDAGDDLTQDDLTSSCAEVVTLATGRTGVVTGPALGLTSTAYATYDGRGAEAAALPLPADATGGWATCGIHAVDGRELAASLRQIGDAPLPWAR